MYTAVIVIKSIRAIPQYNNQLVVGSWSGSGRRARAARFARKRSPCFSSTSLNVSRLNVDMVVKAPSIPTARNSLDDSDRALDLSAPKVMRLNVKEPRMLTPRVPMGNLADPWMAVDRMNLNTAPMKPSSPT